MQKTKLYLPNLNTLRAIAALLVIIAHIERKMELFHLSVNDNIARLGSIGVTLFFSLSGFLITYLLLLEKEKFSKISVKDFYIRRFLRIWPLYYLVLLFVYLLIPYILPEYYSSEIERFGFKSAILNVFFLTNVTMALKYTPLIINPIWSIGVEEQFYLFWPWVVKAKNIFKIIFGIILIIPILKIVCLLFSSYNDFYKILYTILSQTRFDTMAIGGLFGILAYNKKITLKYITINATSFKSKNVQIVVYVAMILFLLFSFKKTVYFNFYNYHILPFLSSIILLNVIDVKSSIFNFENKITNYLGKISYSLYLLHLIVFYFLFPVLQNWFQGCHKMIIIFGVYSISILVAIAIASLSYELIEKHFLKYKKHFTHIQT